MPVPPPRRKVSKEGAETAQNSASRLPRIVGLTTKTGTNDAEVVEKKTFSRFESSRRTFTKESPPANVKETTPTRLSEPIVRKRVSGIQRYPSVSKPALQRSTAEESKLSPVIVKTEKQLLDKDVEVVNNNLCINADTSSLSIGEVNVTSSTNTSSLNLSNLQPSVCNSFDSQPNLSHDGSAKDSSAQSKVPPRRNKLPAPKVQRTSSINGTVAPTRAAYKSQTEVVTSEQPKSGDQTKTRPSSITRSQSVKKVEIGHRACSNERIEKNSVAVKPGRPSLVSQSSSIEKVASRGQKIVRSISSDQPVEDVKPVTKPSYSETNLLEKHLLTAPPRNARSVSKIPTSKGLSPTVSVKPSVALSGGSARSPTSGDATTKRPPLHSLSKKPSFNKTVSSITSRTPNLSRTPSLSRTHPNELPIAKEEKVERPENRSEVSKPPRSSKHLKDRVSLIPSKAVGVNEPQSEGKVCVANVCQADKGPNSATSVEKQEAVDCAPSTPLTQESPDQKADDTAVKSCFISHHTKQLTVPNDKSGASSTITSDVRERRNSVERASNPERCITESNQLESKPFLELLQGAEERSVAAPSQVGCHASTPLESTSCKKSPPLKKTDLALENSCQLNNEEQDLNNYGSGSESNFLFLRRRKLSQLTYEDDCLVNTEPSPCFSKRSSGQVAKKANRVRDVIKNDASQSEHHKSNLKPEHVSSGILGGSSTQGEIPLLRSSVLPASVYPEKIPVVLNHEDSGCQNNSCPVEKTLGSNKQLSDSDALIQSKTMTSVEFSASSETECQKRSKDLRREKSLVDKPPIPKPARPSLLRRAASSSALLVRSREEKPIVNSEILIVQEDRTVVQIMTGAPVKHTGSIADLRSLETYRTVPIKDNVAKVKPNSDTEEEFHDSLCATIEFNTVDDGTKLANEQLKLSSVTDFAVAEKTDHPQIVSRTQLTKQCELEDILVGTEMKKDTVANDARSDSQFCPSSDVELYEMLPPGYSKCEFDPAAFMQNMVTPQKNKHKSVHSVRSLECSPSRSSSPAKSVREYETAYANIKRRNSELSYENSTEILYSNTRPPSEYSRTSSPMGYAPGVRYDPHRRIYVQDPFPFLLPPVPPKITPIEHDTVFATIRPKADVNHIYDVPKTYQNVGIYGTCRGTRSETYSAYKEHPQRMGFIQPLNPRDLFYSSDSPTVQEVSMQSGLNPSHLVDSCDYAEFVCPDKSTGEFTGSEFTTSRVQDHSLVRRGHGLKAKILRKMSTIAKSKTESPVGTFYKKKSGETPDYATVPGPGHRKIYHSVSRELLSKMELERESIKGAGAPTQEFDSFPENDQPDLPEAVRYERFNPPVLSSRFARVDLVEDPAFQSAVVVIGGEKKVVPLHRESVVDEGPKQGVMKSPSNSLTSQKAGSPVEATTKR